MPSSAQTVIDYAKSLDCIHCGLCLRTCPTYQLTGRESSSPRGRVHLMRAVAEERHEVDDGFREEMDFCLVCRHCESACPAGVRFGAMMEHTRAQLERGPLERLARWLGFRVLLPHRLALRLAFGAQRVTRAVGLWSLASRLGGRLGKLLDGVPAPPPRSEARLLPRETAPRSGETRWVAFLEGCVMPELFGRVNRATVSALAKLGVGTRVPRGVVCCGSLHAHNGDREGARDLARKLIEAVEAERDADGTPLPLVTNSAGCGSHLRELENLFDADDPWHARARALAERVQDFSETVAPLLEGRELAFERTSVADAKGVAWDDPCHLCHGQGVRRPPRDILGAIRGLPLKTLREPESCCGSAGIYSLLRPADGADVFAGKRADFESSGADALVTANPGCHMQWQGGLAQAGSDARVRHLAELVDEALE